MLRSRIRAAGSAYRRQARAWANTETLHTHDSSSLKTGNESHRSKQDILAGSGATSRITALLTHTRSPYSSFTTVTQRQPEFSVATQVVSQHIRTPAELQALGSYPSHSFGVQVRDSIIRSLCSAVSTTSVLCAGQNVQHSQLSRLLSAQTNTVHYEARAFQPRLS